MFARLKEKIQKEGGNVSDGDRTSLPGHGSPRRSSFTSSPAQSPLTKDLTTTDSDSANEEPVAKLETMNKEEILVLLRQRTKRCIKQETQITECISMIKDKNKNLEKLESCMEQQQDAAAKRAQELNEQYQARRVSLSDSFKSEMERKEREKQEVLDKLRDMEEVYKKYSKLEEEKEELEGFTNQELGKVKHLLILSQQELSKCKDDLAEKCSLFDVEAKKNKELADKLSAESQKATSLQSQRDQYKGDSMDNAKLISALTKERMSLEGQLIDVKAELSEKHSWITSLQSKNTDLENSHQALVRNTDVQKNKSGQLLQEKADHIEQLQDRVRTFEQREHDQTLSGDDRVLAFEKERDVLEKKLTEAREQLSQIKSSWSDKISHLEDQISHLNRKIVEDNEELAHSENTTQTLRENFQKEVERLKESIRESEKQTSQQIALVKDRESQMDKLKRDLEAEVTKARMEKYDLDTQLRANIASLESQLLSLETAKLHEKSALEDQISRYVHQEKDGIEKLVKSERRVEELEESNTKLQISIVNQEKLCENLRVQCKQMTGAEMEKGAQIQKLQEDLQTVQKKLETTQQSSKSKSTELSSSTKERDALMLRNAELSQQLTGLQQSMNDEQRTLQADLAQRVQTEGELRQRCDQMEEHGVHMERKVEELQLAHSHQQDNSIQAEHLQETIASLEDQLADKNRALKKQEQRLGDLKKTLQRELKVQSLPNDEPLDGRVSANTPPTVRKSSQSRNSHHSDAKSRPRRETSCEPSPVSHDSSQEGYDRLTQNSHGIPQLTGHHYTPQGANVAPHSNSALKPHPGVPPDAPGDLYAAAYHSKQHVLSKKFSTRTFDVRHLEKDVNFLYLKHVVMKFMLSRESEALHLIKAVSLLLRLSPEEQKLMRDTIEWKMSWFGGSQPPAVLRGHLNKIIPPSY